MNGNFVKTVVIAAFAAVAVSGCGKNYTEVQTQTETGSLSEAASDSVDSTASEKDNERILEQEATAAIQKCWNFTDGTLQPGATRELWEDAANKINACNDADFKESMKKVSQKVAEGFAEQDEKKTEQEAMAAIQKCWNFSDGKIQPGVTRALLNEAKDKINACNSNEFKNSLQSAVEAVDQTLTAQEKEQVAEQSARAAIQKCWNFPKGTLQNGATRALLNDAKSKINACSNANFKDSLQAAIVAADQALSVQEKEQEAERQASEAIQKCWNFPEGRLQDGATRNLLNDAKKKISLCSNAEFKNSLQEAVTAADQALTANEEAERQQAAANNNTYNSGNNSYNDDSNWDAYQAQKERDWDQYQREKEESYQRNRGKSYEERRRDYERVYQDNQRRRENTYRRYH